MTPKRDDLKKLLLDTDINPMVTCRAWFICFIKGNWVANYLDAGWLYNSEIGIVGSGDVIFGVLPKWKNNKLVYPSKSEMYSKIVDYYEL
jgi:hypothetical protein